MIFARGSMKDTSRTNLLKLRLQIAGSFTVAEPVYLLLRLRCSHLYKNLSAEGKENLKYRKANSVFISFQHQGETAFSKQENS